MPITGLLRHGKAADVVVFDPDVINDTATYDIPKSFPEGVEYVLVNCPDLGGGWRSDRCPGRACSSVRPDRVAQLAMSIEAWGNAG